MELLQQTADSNFQLELIDISLIPESIYELTIAYDSTCEAVRVTDSEDAVNVDLQQVRNASCCVFHSPESTNNGGQENLRKAMGPPCKCRLDCHNKVTEEIRKKVYNYFWNDCTWEQRKQYVALAITESPKSRSRCRGPIRTERRHLTLTYTLLYDNIIYKVCKSMFLNTLAISEKFIRLIMSKKRSSINGVMGADFKCKHIMKSKAAKEMVREHIKSFPTETLPDDKSGRKYLDASLNVSAMHKLYVKHCQNKNIPKCDIVRQAYYREIFKSEFNLAFKTNE